MHFHFVNWSVSFVVAVFVIGVTSNDIVSSSEEMFAAEIDCSTGKYHPHELYCDWYYECVNNVPRPVRCPSGLHFSAEQSVCVLPEFSNCNVS